MPRTKEPVLTRERIAKAALEIADERGKLSMKALAASLGVGAPALYHYVDGIDGVLELMRDAIHREQGPKIDPTWSWQETVRHVAYHDRDSIGEHPWLAADIMISVTSADEPLGSVVTFAEVLERAGFTPKEVYLIIGTIDVYSAGGALDLGAPERVYPIEAELEENALGRALRANPKGRDRADAVFEFALDAFIDSLERLLKARAAA